MSETTVGTIAGLVGGIVVGDPDTIIRGFNGIRQAGPGDLSFVSESRYAKFLEGCTAAALLVPPGLDTGSIPAIQVKDPYSAFLMALQQSMPVQSSHPHGIHSTAVIEEDAVLGKDAAVGANAYIGQGAQLGDGVVIYPNAYIGPNCTIGARTVLYSNASVREGCTVGADCIIHNGAVIGSDGFGFFRKEGRQHKIPQLGTVEIGDDVEVGANAAIDRAMVGKTHIGSGTKIDNLVQIGHNTVIGEQCILCGNVGISGSAILGNGVTLAAGAGVAGHLEIGDNVTVAALSGVTKSIPSGRVVSGFPAVDHDKEKRIKASLRRVPESLTKIRDLERRITELEKLSNARETEDDS